MNKYSTDQILQIKQDKDTGLTRREVAEKNQLTFNNVRYILTKKLKLALIPYKANELIPPKPYVVGFCWTYSGMIQCVNCINEEELQAFGEGNLLPVMSNDPDIEICDICRKPLQKL